MARTRLAATVAAILLPPAAAPAWEAPRTFYESLDTTTAEAAARTFLSAYASSDYAAVFLLLSPPTQGEVMNGFYRYDIGNLVPNQGPDFMAQTAFFGAGPLSEEFTMLPELIFDDVMFTAERLDLLPFRVAADFQVSVGAASGATGAVPATVKTRAWPPSVTMWLVHMPSGRWKVDRVSWEGSNPEARPWGGALEAQP